jgi:hypothetical protein
LLGGVIGFFFGMSHMKKAIERELMQVINDFAKKIEE